MFIGVIIVAIIALIVLVAVVIINQNMAVMEAQQIQIDNIQREMMLDDAIKYCNTSISFPISQYDVDWVEACLIEAFATYGTQQQYQDFLEGLERIAEGEKTMAKMKSQLILECQRENIGDVHAMEDCEYTYNMMLP